MLLLLLFGLLYYYNCVV